MGRLERADDRADRLVDQRDPELFAVSHPEEVSTIFAESARRRLRGVDALARIASEPSSAGLFLDIDGVLAPIVERPEDARVPAETRQELRRLGKRYALVACVTGRPSEV